MAGMTVLNGLDRTSAGDRRVLGVGGEEGRDRRSEAYESPKTVARATGSTATLSGRLPKL